MEQISHRFWYFFFFFSSIQSALVSIGEHGTRLLYREEGSPERRHRADLSARGLLWGTLRPRDDESIEIWDAEDAPHGDSKPLERVIDPQQVVVGWYRLDGADEPTPDDVLQSQQWQQRYASTTAAPFLFALASKKDRHRLSFYMLPPASASAVPLLPLTDDRWSLRTAPCERWAVECLFPLTPPAWPELDARLQPLERALLGSLEPPSSGAPEQQHAAWRRHVQGLLDHLALGPSQVDRAEHPTLLPALAALAQCVAATQPYLEKHRALGPSDAEASGRRGPAGDRAGMPWRSARRYASGKS
jgi:hypothetical protein